MIIGLIMAMLAQYACGLAEPESSRYARRRCFKTLGMQFLRRMLPMLQKPIAPVEQMLALH